LDHAGHDVVFVARGAHLEAMRDRGLEVRRGEQRIHLHPVNAIATPDQAGGMVDLVMFAVKCYDLESAAEALRPVVSPETSLLTLQNGIDAPDELAARLGTGHVLAGTAAIFSAIVEPGVIETGPLVRITLGERSGEVTPRVHAVAAVLREAGVEAIVSSDARRALWEKLLLLAPNATITSACGLPMGPIRERPEGAALYRKLVDEVTATGRAAGVNLDSDAAEQAYATLMSLPPDSTTSMQRDFAAHRRVELAHITGAVVREARKHSVPVPAFETLYAVLKVRALA